MYLVELVAMRKPVPLIADTPRVRRDRSPSMEARLPLATVRVAEIQPVPDLTPFNGSTTLGRSTPVTRETEG